MKHKGERSVVSATNVARAGKRGNICVGNNVSLFARAVNAPHSSGQKRQNARIPHILGGGGGGGSGFTLTGRKPSMQI